MACIRPGTALLLWCEAYRLVPIDVRHPRKFKMVYFLFIQQPNCTISAYIYFICKVFQNFLGVLQTSLPLQNNKRRKNFFRLGRDVCRSFRGFFRFLRVDGFCSVFVFRCPIQRGPSAVKLQEAHVDRNEIFEGRNSWDKNTHRII